VSDDDDDATMATPSPSMTSSATPMATERPRVEEGTIEEGTVEEGTVEEGTVEEGTVEAVRNAEGTAEGASDGATPAAHCAQAPPHAARGKRAWRSW
jgi:hypothetical protein